MGGVRLWPSGGGPAEFSFAYYFWSAARGPEMCFLHGLVFCLRVWLCWTGLSPMTWEAWLGRYEFWLQFLGLRVFSGFQHSGVYILFAFQSCCFTVVLYCFVFVKTKNVTYQGFYKQEKFWGRLTCLTWTTAAGYIKHIHASEVMSSKCVCMIITYHTILS